VGAPLRSLEGIYFPVFLLARDLKVRGHAAASESPFDGRIRKNQAIIAGGSFHYLLAAFTFFDNGVAVAPVELTTFVAHEGTLYPFLDACTNHGYHILSFGVEKNKTLFMPDIISVVKNKKRPQG
jgi:hypothetical protein